MSDDNDKPIDAEAPTEPPVATAAAATQSAEVIPIRPRQETPHYVRRSGKQLEKAYKEAVADMARWMASNNECAGLEDGPARRHLAACNETLSFIIMGGMLHMVPMVADDGGREQFIIALVNDACAKALAGMRQQLAAAGLVRS